MGVFDTESTFYQRADTATQYQTADGTRFVLYSEGTPVDLLRAHGPHETDTPFLGQGLDNYDNLTYVTASLEEVAAELEPSAAAWARAAASSILLGSPLPGLLWLVGGIADQVRGYAWAMQITYREVTFADADAEHAPTGAVAVKKTTGLLDTELSGPWWGTSGRVGPSLSVPSGLPVDSSLWLIRSGAAPLADAVPSSSSSSSSSSSMPSGSTVALVIAALLGLFVVTRGKRS